MCLFSNCFHVLLHFSGADLLQPISGPFLSTCIHFSNGCMAFLSTSFLMVSTVSHACVMYDEMGTYFLIRSKLKASVTRPQETGTEQSHPKERSAWTWTFMAGSTSIVYIYLKLQILKYWKSFLNWPCCSLYEILVIGLHILYWKVQW